MLLQQSWPVLHPLVTTAAGGVVAFLAAWFWRGHDARKAARAAELAAAAQAQTDKLEWDALCAKVTELERVSRSFMPEGSIREELKKLGVEIADNQGKIKLLHDRGEDVSNSLNFRVSTLEQHNAALTLLPGQVQKLNTDHAVLAAEVRQLTNKIESLDKKQDEHFRDLMAAVQGLAYTRGELHGGQRRPQE